MEYREEFEDRYPKVFRELYVKAAEENKPQLFRSEDYDYIYGEIPHEFDVIGRAKIMYRVFPDGSVDRGYGKMQNGSAKKDCFIIRRGERKWSEF